jgi:hypothetical protein
MKGMAFHRSNKGKKYQTKNYFFKIIQIGMLLLKNIGDVIVKSLFKGILGIVILLIISLLLNTPVPLVLSLLLFIIFFTAEFLLRILRFNQKEAFERRVIEHLFSALFTCLVLILWFVLSPYLDAPFFNWTIDVNAIILQISKQPVIVQTAHFFRDNPYLNYIEVFIYIVLIFFIGATKRDFSPKVILSIFISFILIGLITYIFYSGWIGLLLSMGGMLTPVVILIIFSRFNFQIGRGGLYIAVTIGAIMGPLFVSTTIIAFLAVLWVISRVYQRIRSTVGPLIRLYVAPNPDLPEHPVYNTGTLLATGALIAWIGFVLFEFYLRAQ